MSSHAESDKDMEVPDSWEERYDEEAVDKPDKAVGGDPKGGSNEDEGKGESNGDKPSEVVSKVVSSEKDPGVGNPEEGAALKVLVSMSDEPIPVKRKDPSGKVTRTQKAGAGAGKTSKPVTKPTKRIKPRSKSLTYSWAEVQNLMKIRLKKLSQPDQNGNESKCNVTGDAKACKRKGEKKTSKGQRVEHGEASPLLKPKKSSKLARANKEKVRVSHKPLTTVVVKTPHRRTEKAVKGGNAKVNATSKKSCPEENELSKRMEQTLKVGEGRLPGQSESHEKQKEEAKPNPPPVGGAGKSSSVGSKKKWYDFESEEALEAYKARKKMRNAAKRRKQAAKKQQSVAASKTLPVENSTAKSLAKSSSEPKTAKPLAIPKPSKGAPSLGKRAGDAETYVPVPKRLKGQVSKKSEVIQQMAAWHLSDDEAVMAEPLNSRAGLLARRGSKSVAELSAFSAFRLEGGEAPGHGVVNWADSTYHPSSCMFTDGGRLRYYEIEPSRTGRIASMDHLTSEPLMDKMLAPGSTTFHSSYIAELERSIDEPEFFTCSQCSSFHSLTRSPTTILVTENMACATFRSPVNCTVPEEEKPLIPKASPNTHCDVLFLPGGLKSSALEVFQTVYGAHKGKMNIIVDMGDRAIRDGESVESVRSQLMSLARGVISIRPLSDRESTRVLLPLRFQSKDGRVLVLNPWDNSVQLDIAVQMRLCQLNVHLRNLNTRLGHVSSPHDVDSAVLCDGTFKKETIIKQADAGGRIVQKVQLVDQGNTRLDTDGRLHPTKMGIFTKIHELLTYVNTPSPAVKWANDCFH